MSKFHLDGGHTAHLSAQFPVLPVKCNQAYGVPSFMVNDMA
jgi:hypothetical protein